MSLTNAAKEIDGHNSKRSNIFLVMFYVRPVEPVKKNKNVPIQNKPHGSAVADYNSQWMVWYQ